MKLTVATICAVALLVAGCGDDDTTTTATETVTQTEPTTTGEEPTTTTTKAETTEGPVGPLAPAAIGPLPIGASEDEARAAFGQPDEIQEVSLSAGPAPQVSWTYELPDGTVVLKFATETGELRQYDVTSPSLATDEGIAVGSLRRDVVLAYGNGLPLAPIGEGLLVSEGEPGSAPALTLNFDGKTVFAITGGDLLQPAGE